MSGWMWALTVAGLFVAINEAVSLYRRRRRERERRANLKILERYDNDPS